MTNDAVSGVPEARSELAGAASDETKAEPTGWETEPRVDPFGAGTGIPARSERDQN